MLNKGGCGQPKICEEDIDHVRQPCAQSVMKSVCTAARELELPCATVHKVLCKNL